MLIWGFGGFGEEIIGLTGGVDDLITLNLGVEQLI